MLQKGKVAVGAKTTGERRGDLSGRPPPPKKNNNNNNNNTYKAQKYL